MLIKERGPFDFEHLKEEALEGLYAGKKSRPES